jgi:hypothetical protein
MIWRAITKFYAVYSDVSPQMQSWAKSMREALSAERANEAQRGPKPPLRTTADEDREGTRIRCSPKASQ